jgi:uncharacterized membrane protein
VRHLLEFVRTTLLGGFAVILPVAAVLLLVERVLAAARAALRPLMTDLPYGARYPGLVAALVAAGVCFVAGLVLRTGAARRAMDALEHRALEHIPAYSLLRSLTRRMIGQEEGTRFAAALAVIEEALVPAFIVEEHEDGRYTVFVPSVPTLAVGALYILPRERVHPVDVPFHRAVACVRRWGVGSGELLRAMRRP